MCGIAGIWQPGSATSCVDVAGMLSQLEHRGPDDEGLWQNHGLVLGQRRLAILDLSEAGHQPMLSKSGQLAITFNGEIYNFLELRKELEGSGKRFHSQTDTEVLLSGYEQWGTAVLERLVGMFAFALWDSTRQSLFLARDRAGEKPLYYAHSAEAEGFAFSSELAALKDVEWIDFSMDETGLASYLHYGYIPAPYTIYRGVRKLPAGHAMTVAETGVQIWRYWDPLTFAQAPRLELSEAAAAEQLDALLKQAVKGQMIADVPLGAFLSGGIDSSAVVAMMSELASGPVKTFTIGFDIPNYDEAAYAEAVAKHLRTEHTTEYLTEKDALDLVSVVPEMYGEPFADQSALPTHLVSQVARKQVTVSLSGDGGDELFGGYLWYKYLDRLQKLRISNPAAGLLRPLVARMPGRWSRLAPLLGQPLSEVHRGFMNNFNREEVRALVPVGSCLREFERSWALGDSYPHQQKAMLADFLTFMTDDVLAKVDRAAMATSLETRAPLLDHRLMEFSLQLPETYLKNKSLLRQVVYKRIPQDLLARPKQGFAVPVHKWLRNELRDLLVDALAPSQVQAMGLHDTKLVSNLITEHLTGKRNHSSRLWTLLVLSLWHEHQKQPSRYQASLRVS